MSYLYFKAETGLRVTDTQTGREGVIVGQKKVAEWPWLWVVFDGESNRSLIQKRFLKPNAPQ